MEKILIILFLFLSVNNYSQSDSIGSKKYTLKVIPIKTISSEVCAAKDLKNNAVTLEFDVLKKEDQKLYGKKVYACILCYDFPGEGFFKNRGEYDLVISEGKYYNWEIEILNEVELKKNVDQKVYWIRSLSSRSSH